MRAATRALAYARRFAQAWKEQTMMAIGVSEASNNTVYAAIELSKKMWVLGIAARAGSAKHPQDLRGQRV
jgi:hypothetical protein